jgi:uncharacterized protein YcgL (UPF0745 family)
MENLIREKIGSASTLKQAEQYAEKLTYEISANHQKSQWRTRYEYLKYDDFKRLGWRVMCIGAKSKDVTDWLVENGYKQHRKDKIYFNAEKREMFMVGEYPNGESMSIDDYGGAPALITLDEYKQLLIEKLLELNEKKIQLQEFVLNLIKEHKDYLEMEENERLKQHIIYQALEKARQDKLII